MKLKSYWKQFYNLTLTRGKLLVGDVTEFGFKDDEPFWKASAGDFSDTFSVPANNHENTQ